MFLKKPPTFHIDNDRCYYEPRVLWASARVGRTIDLRSETQPAGFVKLPKEFFWNGSQYPIRITHTIISPVGYLFRDRAADNAGQFDQAMAGLGRVKIRIAFPKSSWIERLDTDVMSFATEPTAEPSFDDDPTLDYASGLFGLSRWTFDPSYILPAKATIDLALSSVQGYEDDGGVGPIASMAFYERGGRMLGHARTRAPLPLEVGSSFAADGLAFPQNRVPTIGDQYALVSGVTGDGQLGAFQSPAGAWPSNVYNHQLSSRGLPYTEVTGFAVALDQSQIDDNIHTSNTYTHTGRLAPIAQRVITKARTRDAGTQQRWWRDGAPLSLVTPTQNSCGFVHKWDEPFFLGPGEGLEVSLQAPPTRTVQFPDEPPSEINPVYNVGVSFLGYAVVEDFNQKVYRSSAA